jgi:hypothetical protein
LNSPVVGFLGIYLNGSYLDVLSCAFESIFNFLKASCNEKVDETNVRFMSDEETQHMLKSK